MLKKFIVITLLLVVSAVFCLTGCKPKQNDVDIATTYPELFAMSSLATLDGSYNGTDAFRGYPQRLQRENDTFTTYPIGYGEKTTGGRGASLENIYECATGLEILSAIETIKQKQATDSNLKSIIKVTSEINQENTTESGATALVYQIVPNSVNNLTIIGASSSAVFYGVGINFKSSNNIIVQNLTIHHPSYKLKNEKDCLEFNSCNNVWVDHCEIYNDNPTNSSEKDYFDGLIDVKNQSSGVTISYNYLHDAWKTSLVGSGPDDLCETRTITYHHNIFRNLNSRVPAIRSGYGHIYNNLYDGIKSSGANCRINAEVYIEDNIFENSKKPVCADEDSVKGFYNISSGNVFTNCVSVPTANTTDFTPSYAYVLDDTKNLKSYLEKTVGVNKIDAQVQCEMDSGYNNTYEIAEYLLINRAIDELPTISLNNDCLQRLVYLSKKSLILEGSEIAKVTNFDKLITAINQYIDLYVSDLDLRIENVDFSANFSENALNFLQAKNDYENATEFIGNKITKKSVLDALDSDYKQNFVNYFNNQTDSLQPVTSESMPTILGLLQLYDGASEEIKSSLKYQELNDAYNLSNARIVASEFETLCENLPNPEQITHANSVEILNAINLYNELTELQYSFVSSACKDKFLAVYNKVAMTSRKMELGQITDKKVLTDSVKAGDINLSKNMEVVDTNTIFDGKTYEKTAYISGYGNKGTKSLWFTVYCPCDIEIVLNTIDSAGKFVIADANGTVIKNFTTENADVVKITISDLSLGEYRLYTAMADEVYTSTKAYVYDFLITPKKVA